MQPAPVASGPAIPVGQPALVPPTEQTMVVYGIAMEDPQLAMLVKRVLNASMLVTLFFIVSTVIDLAIARDSKFVVVYVLVLIMLLLIPACGYFGAKSRNRDMVGGFCLSNLLCAVCGACNIVLVIAAMSTNPAAGVVVLLANIVGVAVSSYAFYYGNALYNHPYFTQIHTAPSGRPVVQSTVQAVQPMPAYGMAPVQGYPMGYAPAANPYAGAPVYPGMVPQGYPAGAQPREVELAAGPYPMAAAPGPYGAPGQPGTYALPPHLQQQMAMYAAQPGAQQYHAHSGPVNPYAGAQYPATSMAPPAAAGPAGGAPSQG